MTAIGVLAGLPVHISPSEKDVTSFRKRLKSFEKRYSIF